MATTTRTDRYESFTEHCGDIFPKLGLFIGCGVIMGATASMMLAKSGIHPDINLLALCGLGASLGGIFGLFVGLSQTVRYFSLPASLPELTSPQNQLWDPWVDSGQELDDLGLKSISVVMTTDGQGSLIQEALEASSQPVQARVRPRIISAVTGEAVLLEDQIGQLLQEDCHKHIGLIGGPGSGKSTALRHLAAVLPSWALARVQMVDDPQGYADTVQLGNKDHQVFISAGCHLPSDPHRITYRLAAWNQDDLIEYLLTAQWDSCASVMARLRGNNDHGFLKGIPELWTVVLDRMACNESVHDVRTALRSELAAWFDKQPQVRLIAEDLCLNALGQTANMALKLPLSALGISFTKRMDNATKIDRLIRHRPVALLLAANRIKDLAGQGQINRAFTKQFPRDLVQEAAHILTGDSLALQHLSGWLNHGEHSLVHPMAASLLHAVTSGWRPDSACKPNLNGAYLGQAMWAGLNLAGVDLSSADLSRSNLRLANLSGSHASGAHFRCANLQGADLNSCVAFGANLSEANLRSVRAVNANFRKANLVGAHLVEANLWRANLQEANIEGADFTGANLEDATLRGLKLKLARFHCARFGGADLRGCDLENMVLTVPDFHDTDLRGALLTGSRLQEANFVGANLSGAGLAEIDWPGADLRDADLRGASFHLGSSRNGLVGSLIACEGSRTGFYTDDYDDQIIKSPEEIRKANLRGADLRGANIDDVDFYLVDLREAKYTSHQARHLRRCRAILKTPTC